jgi:anaerobic selenocysteine-containing dehydrogenase
LEAGEQLFEAILSGRGTVFTVDDYGDAWHYVRRPDRRFTVEIPELLEKLRRLADEPSSWVSEEFPLVLSAGERRSYTANTIIRDPAWRKRDGDGALRVGPADAERLGLATGARALLTTEAGDAEVTIEVSEMLAPGHVSLPNGLGVDHSDGASGRKRTGVAANELTSLGHRDWLAGTPWHKYVPARVEAVSGRDAA